MNADNYVGWRWANGIAEGRVVLAHYQLIEVGCNDTPNNPAMVTEHASGNPVQKLANEAQKRYE